MLYQNGYLTIKSYDPEDQTYALGFPNKEVKGGFLTMLAASYFKAEGVTSTLLRMADALEAGSPEEVRKILTVFFAPSSLRRKSGGKRDLERDFQDAFYLIMNLVGGYLAVAEHRQARAALTAWWRQPSSFTSSRSSVTAPRRKHWNRSRRRATPGNTRRIRGCSTRLAATSAPRPGL